MEPDDKATHIETLEKRIAALKAENAKLKEALEQIRVGSASNSGRCMDCNSINQVACLALSKYDSPAAQPKPQEGDR